MVREDSLVQESGSEGVSSDGSLSAHLRIARHFMGHKKRLFVYCLHRIVGDNTKHMDPMILARVSGAYLPSRWRCADGLDLGLHGISASREYDTSTIVRDDIP